MNKNIYTIAAFIALSACTHTSSVCGTYQGILPAADGPGIEMTITLNQNNRFKNKIVYLEKKDGTFFENGTFSVRNNILQLSGNENISYYKIEDGQLRLLDFEKQEITGALADYYILKKIKNCNR